MIQSKSPQHVNIIRRPRRILVHRDSGVWKIAYADFITSMMIFFMTMWLLSLVSNTGKAEFSEYFKRAQLEEGEPLMIKRAMKERKDKVKSNIVKKIATLSDNLTVEMLDSGVRIQMWDSKDSSLFESGNAKPTKDAEKMFKIVADSIKGLPNKIAIEGHTDSVPYAKGEISNWELSAMRAAAAKVELEKNGIPPFKIDRIVGCADTRPLIKENPADRRNRRISIFLDFELVEAD
ncbi:MAG: OmpA family protein [Nitrospirae bacterium]|nr:OmpA family protein [Nitrospirota bacterium]